MSEVKHTPGPWVWNGKHGSLHRIGEAPYRFGECVLRPTWEYDEGTDLEIGEADAALIAAAPDILEALSGLLADVYEIFASPEQLEMAAELARKGRPAIAADSDGPDTIKAARAALSKATLKSGVE